MWPAKQFVCFIFSNFTIKKSAIEKSYSEVSNKQGLRGICITRGEYV